MNNKDNTSKQNKVTLWQTVATDSDIQTLQNSNQQDNIPSQSKCDISAIIHTANAVDVADVAQQKKVGTTNQLQETSPRPLPSYLSNLAIFKLSHSAPRSRCHAAAGIWEQLPKTNVSKAVALPRTWRRSAAPPTPLLLSPKHLVQGDTGSIEQQR